MSEGSIAIRTGVDEDREWCARLMALSEPWTTLGQSLEMCREKLARVGMELFVAREPNEEKRLGFILLAAYGFAGSPYVSSIGVASEERGRGIGAQLLRFAERHFAGRGRLFLLVSSFNVRAQEFYQREGYQFAGELKDYIVQGHSELICYKRLA